MTASQDSGVRVSLPSSGEQVPPGKTTAPTAAKAKAAPAKPSGIWLNGNVLACACPQCHAPVSIRAWLMMGDCLLCGTSVELTEEQEQEARRLLRERELTKQAAAPATPSATPAPTAPVRPAEATKVRAKTAQSSQPSAPAAPTARQTPRATPTAVPAPTSVPAPPPAPRRVPAATRPVGAQVRVYKLAHFGSARTWLSDFLQNLPAWLVSLVFHLVLFLLLGLWANENNTPEDTITLSATMGTKDLEGERAIEDPVVDEVQFEDPGEPPVPPAEAQAVADAEELQMPANEKAPNLPEMRMVLTAMKESGTRRMFEGRDPRVRAQVVNREGGTTYTEAAVARGLRWLAKHQSSDGSWSLDRFHTAGDCNGQCGHHGQASDHAGTALVLLPFLGAGQTHLQGRYTKHVEKGIRWLLEHQGANGDLRGNGVGNMYAHGQATIVLCEAYAITGDESLRDAAQRAVDFIVDAQHHAGGWRYNPGEPGDTSVVGWQLMALRSAKMAQLDVADRTFRRAAAFLDDTQTDRLGATYSYQPGGPPTPAMTAEALLCRQYLGWPAHEPGMEGGQEYLLRHLPSAQQPNIYYWYYATQVMHHLGGEPWEIWNEEMRNTLVAMQETEGHQAGSWTPQGGAIGNHDTHTGGRLYMTSLAICTLEVYYRHLPIYRTIPVANPAAGKPRAKRAR